MPIFIAEEKPQEGDVVVAIDFGTSRTAWCWTTIGDERIEVEKLEGAGSFARVDLKTPTSILVEKNRALAFGYTAEQKFAEEFSDPDAVKPNWMLFKWFKMNLHRAFEDDPLIESVNGAKLPLSVVLQRSLEYVCEEAMRKLTEKNVLLEGKTPHDVFWVLTLPAIWSDHAKAVMRRAAFRAGLISSEQSSRLLLALEPECAAIASQMDPNQRALWQVGSRFLIADCGGGTLDITAHEVVGVEPLLLRELMPPQGGPFGATQVDFKFLSFFEDFLGRDQFQQLKKELSGVFLSLTKEWEEKKQQFRFDGDNDDWTQLKVGDVLSELELGSQLDNMVDQWNRNNGARQVKKIGRMSLSLSRSLMLSFFEEPVNSIAEKVEEVIETYASVLKPLDCVVMAGGFSNCSMLQRKLKERCQGGTQLVVANRPDLLIVQGAAAFGARPLDVVESRKSKYTFGVKSVMLGMIEMFSVHGKKGDDLPVGERTPRQSYRPTHEDQEAGKVEILCSQNTEVTLRNEEGVEELGHVMVPFDQNRPFNERCIDIEFSFGTTEIKCYIYDGNTGELIGQKVPEFNFFS